MTWVAGVDGCKRGWFVILLDIRTGSVTHKCCLTLVDVINLPQQPSIIAIDMPIGLLNQAVHGGRLCEIEARAILGKPRRSSVFSSPVRQTLSATTFNSATRINRSSSPSQIGISIQSYHILRKINETDNIITVSLQCRIKEVHPELCFFEMSKNRSLAKKKSKQGKDERKKLLIGEGFSCVDNIAKSYSRTDVALDDILDACAAAWTARRIIQKMALRIPVTPVCDNRGLLMEMWR